MKKIATVSIALCLSLMAAGCSGNTNSQTSEPAASVTGSETSETTSVEESQVSHDVTVEEVTETLEDQYGEYTCTYPKIIVDGVEATEANTYLSSYIKDQYPLEKIDDQVEGNTVKFKWGSNENTVSIIFTIGAISEDYYTFEVFNYDLDTLTILEDSEVTKRLGMTDSELFDKTKVAYQEFLKGKDSYDFDKSISDLNYDVITPYITPEGNPGVMGRVFYAADSQFSGMESMRCFELV